MEKIASFTIDHLKLLPGVYARNTGRQFHIKINRHFLTGMQHITNTNSTCYISNLVRICY